MISRADRKSGKQQYRELFALVGEVVREWDPCGLLAGGAPRDEFDGEIGRVVAQVPRIHSAADATAVVSRVFGSAFEREEFAIETCAPVGERLFARLRAGGFV